ncbi:MAG TPA: hypothetical protein VGM86_32935 [Thermoanaerobaculia bacterium]|jgi:hypothetical protein
MKKLIPFLICLLLKISSAEPDVTELSHQWDVDLVREGIFRVSAPVLSSNDGILVPMTASPVRGQFEDELILVDQSGSKRKLEMGSKLKSKGSYIIGALPRRDGGWLALAGSSAGRLGVFTINLGGQSVFLHTTEIPSIGLRLRGALALSDGGTLVIGQEESSPAALRLTSDGTVLWWKVFGEIGPGALVDAWEDERGDLLVAGTVSGEASSLNGSRRIWLARLSPKAEVLKSANHPGSACALLATGGHLPRVLSTERGTSVKVSKLNPDLSLTDQHTLDAKAFSLGRIPAVVTSDGRVAILGVKDVMPELIWFTEAGQKLASVQIPGALPSLEAQLVRGDKDSVYAVVPLIPKARGAGAMETGVRILKYFSPLKPASSAQ